MSIQVRVDKSPYEITKEIDKIQFSKAAIGGYLWLIVNLKRNLRFKYHDIELFENIWVMDGAKELWRGKISKTPKEHPYTINLNVVGPWKHLGDQRITRLYDERTQPQTRAYDGNSQSLEYDTNNRIRIAARKGQEVPATVRSYIYVQAPYGRKIKKISYDYSVDLDTNVYFNIVAGDGEPPARTDSQASWNSTTASGSNNHTLATARDGVRFELDTGALVTATKENFGLVSNFVVQDDHGLTNIYLSEVIKELRDNVLLLMSVDNTDIEDTTYALQPFFFRGATTAQGIIGEANKYHGFNVGVRGHQLLDGTPTSDSKPALYLYEHDDTTVHYITDKEHCKFVDAGKSEEGVYNEVLVSYQDNQGYLQYVVANATDGYLQERITAGDLPSGYKKTYELSHNTTSSTKAQKIADEVLAEVKNLRASGTCTIKGTVKNQYGAEIPVSHIEPGYNIRIKDIETTEEMFSSSDVRNAANTFKVDQVTIDYIDGVATASLDLDNPGAGRLDVILARLMRSRPQIAAPFEPAIVPLGNLDSTEGGRIR